MFRRQRSAEISPGVGEDEAEFVGEEESALKTQINLTTGTMTRDDRSEHYLEQRVDMDAAAELKVILTAPKPSQAT